MTDPRSEVSCSNPGGTPTDGGHACEAPSDATRWKIPPRPLSGDFPPPPAKLHRRWDRVARLLGEAALFRLFNSHVVVCGLGGVGSYAVEGLARSGVGRLSLVDFDDVCATNFNRQLHAVRGSVGRPKAALMAERVRAINPDAWVEAVEAFYEASTSDAILTPQPDLVVDAIDNVTAKLHLIATCWRRGIPIISSMGAAGRLDPTRVRCDDLAKTRDDPLARSIRKNLRIKYDLNVGRKSPIMAVYSDEPQSEPQELGYDHSGFECVCPHGEDSPHGCEKRSVIWGTAGFVTSVFGMAAASAAVRRLTLAELPAALASRGTS